MGSKLVSLSYVLKYVTHSMLFFVWKFNINQKCSSIAHDLHSVNIMPKKPLAIPNTRRKQINITFAPSRPIFHPGRKCNHVFSLLPWYHSPGDPLLPNFPTHVRLPAEYLFCEVRLPEQKRLPKYFLSDVITTANLAEQKTFPGETNTGTGAP